MLGSEHNDEFYMSPDGEVRTRTNRCAQPPPHTAGPDIMLGRLLRLRPGVLRAVSPVCSQINCEGARGEISHDTSM